MRALLLSLALAGCMGPSVFELTPDAAQVADAADAREPRTDAAPSEDSADASSDARETSADVAADAPDAAPDAELPGDAATDAPDAPEDAPEVIVADASNDAAEDAVAPAIEDATEAATADAVADAAETNREDGGADASEDAPDVREPTPAERCAALTTCGACLAAARETSGLGCGWCEASRRCRYEDDSSFGCGGGWRAPGSVCR